MSGYDSLYSSPVKNRHRMINKLFTLLLVAACFTASAQSDIDYPDNPDFENDGFVGIEDVLELLSVYGTPFTPEQLLLDFKKTLASIYQLVARPDWSK